MESKNEVIEGGPSLLGLLFLKYDAYCDERVNLQNPYKEDIFGYLQLIVVDNGNNEWTGLNTFIDDMDEGSDKEQFREDYKFLSDLSWEMPFKMTYAHIII
jgi:hypothetical protein